MNNFIKNITLADRPGKDTTNDREVNKLYIAFRNLAATNDPEIYSKEQEDTNYYRASSYAFGDVNNADQRIPVILSQEDERMLFDEYY